jgi:hypothetical protein
MQNANLNAGMVIPYTQYREFCREWNANGDWQKHLRFGQAFFNWANLHKMTQTPWLDKLYNANNTKARAMMLEVIDWEN